ncbi:MAG: phosphodiesterase [Clostridia bacterium]|nr:phosphodiesterase [Clostridia bacterium]
MKWIIASDIHGSAAWCRAMLRAWDEQGADRLLLLGDLLYHGPRNDLPEEYDPKAVIRMLSERGGRILCVRGNCDAEVDQMVLPFPITADCCLLEAAGRMIFATHGHLWHPDKLPPLMPGDALLFGHTHVPLFAEKAGILTINPGSVAIPKEQTPHSCMTLEDGHLRWLDLTGGYFMEADLNKTGGERAC